MVSFATLALWRFGKMECSHLWHQPRQEHWYCFFRSRWEQLTREATSWASCSPYCGSKLHHARKLWINAPYKVARTLVIKALKCWLSAVACPIYVASHMPRLTMTIWHDMKQMHLYVVLAQLLGFNVCIFQISSSFCLMSNRRKLQAHLDWATKIQAHKNWERIPAKPFLKHH